MGRLCKRRHHRSLAFPRRWLVETRKPVGSVKHVIFLYNLKYRRQKSPTLFFQQKIIFASHNNSTHYSPEAGIFNRPCLTHRKLADWMAAVWTRLDLRWRLIFVDKSAKPCLVTTQTWLKTCWKKSKVTASDINHEEHIFPAWPYSSANYFRHRGRDIRWHETRYWCTHRQSAMSQKITRH